MKSLYNNLYSLFFLLIFLTSFTFSQKVCVFPDGYVTPVEFKDNIGLEPAAYSGTYEFGSPVEDEFGNYLGGDGYSQKLEFLIGASNQKIIETYDIVGHEKPVTSVIENFDFYENKITTDSFTGYFRYFKYKTAEGKIKEVECFVTTQDNYEKIFVKVE